MRSQVRPFSPVQQCEWWGACTLLEPQDTICDKRRNSHYETISKNFVEKRCFQEFDLLSAQFLDRGEERAKADFSCLLSILLTKFCVSAFSIIKTQYSDTLHRTVLYTFLHPRLASY